MNRNLDDIYELLNSPDCSFERLDKLFDRFLNNVDDYCDVKRMVAENPRCPVDVLRKLSQDPSLFVRAGVMLNPECPADVLEILAGDDSKYLRAGVLRHRNCTPDICRMLSEDRDLAVRRQLVLADNCPPDLLRELVRDDDFLVSSLALANGNCPVDVLQSVVDAGTGPSYMFRSIADNPVCPAGILQKLSVHENREIRSSVAFNGNCSPETFSALAEDRYFFVRANVAHNSACPKFVLERLADDSSEMVRDAARDTLECFSRVSDSESGLISQFLTDLESGNHLVCPRSDEYKKLWNEVAVAVNRAEYERTARQAALADEYDRLKRINEIGPQVPHGTKGFTKGEDVRDYMTGDEKSFLNGLKVRFPGIRNRKLLQELSFMYELNCFCVHTGDRTGRCVGILLSQYGRDRRFLGSCMKAVDSCDIGVDKGLLAIQISLYVLGQLRKTGETEKKDRNSGMKM